MGRNVEIKAKLSDFRRQHGRAAALADAGPEVVCQEDTFFHCSTGRLKLRELGDGTGELIFYERPDAARPKPSDYVVSPTSDPGSLKAALSRALGVRGVVRKTRTVFIVGQARIHLDEVDGLGRFIELEVVLRPNQTPEQGTAVAEDLMAKLEIADGDLIEDAYIDLLGARENDDDA